MRQQFLPSILALCHELARQRVQPGDTVIDATMGNGHDTLFLAQQVGESGQVLALDIQPAALRSTQALLHDALPPAQYAAVQLFHESHEHLQRLSSRCAKRPPSVIMFNLGYLPGADKSVTTQTAATLQAVNQSLALLARHGLLLIVVYPGHTQGRDEHEALQSWLSELDSRRFLGAQYSLRNLQNRAPYLIAVEKLAD